MKILYVCSELFPYLKTGGLADVSAGLSCALKSLGCDVRLLIPALAHRLQGPQVVRLAMLGTAAVFTLYPLAPTPLLMGLCAAALGLTLGCVQPMIMAMLHQLTPDQRHGVQTSGVDQHFARQLGAVLSGDAKRVRGGALTQAVELSKRALNLAQAGPDGGEVLPLRTGRRRLVAVDREAEFVAEQEALERE